MRPTVYVIAATEESGQRFLERSKHLARTGDVVVVTHPGDFVDAYPARGDRIVHAPGWQLGDQAAAIRAVLEAAPRTWKGGSR